MAKINDFLIKMLNMEGSDLHLSVGSPPKIRASGTLIPLEGEEVIHAELMKEIMQEICSEKRWNQYCDKKDLDFAHEIPGVARFRANYLYNYWGKAAVLRQIPSKILSLEDLNLPKVFKNIAQTKEGLVLVTGPTGSGKSTTLAAIIDYINTHFEKHIITIEDPIEFVHQNKKAVIVHREVGEHCNTFGRALRGAMRADPDIILIGEMRELETIQLALKCATMGMLVFGTLHTNNAPKTIDRIVDAFPAEEQNQIRVMLASCLEGVVSQLLCKRTDKGRIAVHEILLKHEALPHTIRQGAIANIRNIIEGGQEYGMCSMDGTLHKRLQEGVISPEVAYMKANDKASFKSYLPKGRSVSGS
jgi:twitching motility protein PilT